MQVLIFFAILSVLILIHEWGHYIVAKMCGVRVDEFGFGLPPKIKTLFTRKGTEFTLNALPLGGFVRLYGEEYQEGDDTKHKYSDRFFDKPIWQRAAVIVAGVVMNFGFGAVLFGAIYSYIGIPTKTKEVHVEELISGGPAEVAGLRKGDVVVGFETTESLVSHIRENQGKELEFLVKRGEEELKIKATPRVDPPQGEGALGVVLSNTIMKKYPWWQMPIRGMWLGVQEAMAWGRDIAMGMGKLVVDLVTGQGVPKDLAGPIGIYQVSSQVTKFGIIPTLQFVGVLSVNLAILNILPLPALDGGRLVFLGVEMVIGKKRKNKIEGYVHAAGMVALLGLMVLITIRDVVRLIK